MRKIANVLLSALVLGLALVSCTEDEDVKLASIDVTVSFAEGITYSAEGLTVYAVNTVDEAKDSAIADADGMASFANMAPGTYNFSCAVALDEEETYTATGYYNQKITLTATLLSQELVADVPATGGLLLNGAPASDLVISEFYYSGADDFYVTMFKDQYITIYNNSAEVVYADGLYVASIVPQRTGSDKENDPISTLDNSEYIYADKVSQIPGNGTDYPIQPGESVVVAFNANDWTSGGTNVKTVDLSGADFELYAVDWLTENGRTGSAFFDIDNADVTNMNIIYLNVENYGFMSFLSTGASAAIFKLDAPLSATESDVIIDPESSESNPQYYLPIAVSSVIDGIDMLYDAESADYKKMPSNIDAGFGFCAGGTYTSLKVMRKVAETIGDRVVYQDTNNSTDDFESMLVNQ